MARSVPEHTRAPRQLHRGVYLAVTLHNIPVVSCYCAPFDLFLTVLIGLGTLSIF